MGAIRYIGLKRTLLALHPLLLAYSTCNWYKMMSKSNIKAVVIFLIIIRVHANISSNHQSEDSISSLMIKYVHVLYINSIISFHSWCMLGDSLGISLKSSPLRFTEDQSHFSTSCHAKMNLTLNEPI